MPYTMFASPIASHHASHTMILYETPQHVRDLMQPLPVAVIPQTTVDEAQTLMQQRRIQHLPVLDNERLVGRAHGHR